MSKTQSTYPTTIDNTLQTDRISGDAITSDSYDIIEDAIFELETKVGIDSSAITGSIDYKISTLPPSGIKSRIVQIVSYQTGVVATGSTIMPADNTIPQNTEGDEYMTLAITPTNVSNKLMIDVVFNGAITTTNNICVALFQDDTVGALAAALNKSSLASNSYQVVFRHYMTAGTTSATTFKIRAGPSAAATLTFNGVSGGQLFGGVLASSITITEIAV